MEAEAAEKNRSPDGSQAPKALKKKTPLHLYPWRFRNSVQLGVLLVTLGIGFQFFIYVLQASGPDTINVSRPPGVEGFLPIGALLGWKLFFTAEADRALYQLLNSLPRQPLQKTNMLKGFQVLVPSAGEHPSWLF